MPEEKLENQKDSATPDPSADLPDGSQGSGSEVNKESKPAQQDETEPQYKLKWKKPVLLAIIVYIIALVLWLVIKFVVEK